jgi:uncharacterized protein
LTTAVRSGRLGIGLWLLLCATLVWAQALVAVPPLQGRVTDLTGTLTTEQRSQLEQQLAAFEARKGTQVALLMVPTTQPEAIEAYSLRVVEQWKLGRKKVDDGLLLLVAKNDRALRWEVGYGLEGALPDLATARITREIVTPKFRAGDFYGGISAGLTAALAALDGEALPPPPSTDRGEPQGLGSFLPVALVAALVVGGALRAMLGRFVGAIATGGVVGAIAWFMAGALSAALLAGGVAFVFTLLGLGGAGAMLGRGGFGGFGGGGSRGGGGFSGGGGSFGGGGSSGRW